MANYKMRIKLLSDLCVSDGSVYNSVIDTDVCKDLYGFPYIPAKRLKGCLRESALELTDWNMEIDTMLLFGNTGSKLNAGIVRISDALLEDAINNKSKISQENAIFHPQNILDLYSYVRIQTAIDRKTGTAKENSLRTMRVVNKGLEFVSDLFVDETRNIENKDIRKMLEDICANFTHMGISRTRGFGEVAVCIEECTGKSQDEENVKNISVEENGDLLEYELFLEEPIICKSSAGSEESGNDYIEGSKILGIIANRYRECNKEEITALLNKGEMQFSNAYISKNSERYMEVPAYIYSIKNHKKTYINKIYDQNNEAAKKDGETRQLNQMKHCYVTIDKDGKLDKTNVEIEKRYHHKRPDDKSIGRASDEKSFYQISSICKGQRFKGYIKGSKEQIKIVSELLSAKKTCFVGYGSSAEYGKVTIESLNIKKEKTKNFSAKRLLVSLISPALIYNDNAMYSADVDNLVKEVLTELGIEKEYSIEQRYVKYTFIGGYNVTWNKMKPMVQVFDKGTAVIISFNEEVSLSISEKAFLGERRLEGLGEYYVEALSEESSAEYEILNEKFNKENESVDLSKNELAKRISKKLFEEYFRGECIKKARRFGSERNKSTIANMVIMCKEQNSLDGVKKAMEYRYCKGSQRKQNKFTIAEDIIKEYEELKRTKNADFKRKYNVENFECDDIDVKLLNVFLQQIKYAIRSGKVNKIGEESE